MKKVSLKKSILIFVAIVIIIAICFFVVVNRQKNDEITPSGNENFNEQEEWLATVKGNIELSEKETLGESITVTVSLDTDENIDSVALYALQGGISEIEATKIDDGVYEAEINFEELNAEDGYYQFEAVIRDNNGNEKEIISEDTVNYFKTGVSYAHAYKKEDGRTAVQITALDKGEVLVSTTNEAPTVNDARWTKYEAGEEYIIATPEENVENVYVWYKNGENIINAADSGISVMSFADGKGVIEEAADRFGESGYAFNNKNYLRKEIVTITLSKTNIAPADPIEQWDVSLNQDRSVNAYIYTSTEDSAKYDLYICGNGSLIAPENSDSLFGGYTNCSEIKGLNELDVSNVTSMSRMFLNCKLIKNLEGISSWDVSKVTSMAYMFSMCDGITNLEPLSKWNVGKVTTMYGMFRECWYITDLAPLQKWDVSNVEYMGYMFYDCRHIISLEPLEKWNVSNVINMEYMFFSCVNLKSIVGLNEWDVSNVKTMKCMFYRCYSLTDIDLSGWDVSNVIYMDDMFFNCYKLTNITGIEGWNVSKVESMHWMFCSCNSLKSIDISDWDVGNVTNMNSMFFDCNKLTDLGDISGWNVSNVLDMKNMFSECSNLPFANLSNWNTAKVTSDSGMFFECTRLKYLLLGNDFDKIYSFSGYVDDYFADSGASIITLREEPIQFFTSSPYDQYCPAILYVKNATIEQKFEAADTEGMFGTDRIKEILELIGDNVITITTANKYIDPGVNVAGYPSKHLNSCKGLGLTFEADTSAVDNALANKKPGEYTVRYTLKYNGEVFATATRKVIVKSALKIPSLLENYTYTGTEQTAILNDFDPEVMNVTGNKKTDAGSYTAIVTLKNPSSDSWEDGTNTAKTIDWEIKKKSVAVSWEEPFSWVYDGNSHIPIAKASSGVTNETIALTVTTAKTNVGNYTATASLKSVTGGQAKTANYTLTNTTKGFSITAATPGITLKAKTATYSGSAISINTATVTGVSATDKSSGGITYTYYTNSACTTKTPTSTGASAVGGAPKDAGIYYVTATVAAKGNYTANTSAAVTLTINPKSVAVSWKSPFSWVYDGKSHIPTTSISSGVTNETISLTVGTAQTDVGNYTATAEIKSVTGGQAKTSNYTLTNTTQTFGITRKPIAVPTGTNFTYDGAQHTGLAGTVQYTVGGTYQATKVGNYVAKATPTKNYMWEDQTITAKDVNWSITAKSFTAGDIQTSLSQSTYEYDKKQKTPDITVKDGDKVLTPGVDYDVRYENNTEVGTAKVVITGKGNYEGTIEKEFTIQDTTPPTPPVITSKLNQAGGEDYTGGTWTNQNVHVSLQSTDYSDIQKYQYREGTTGEWKDMPAGGVKLYDMEMNQELYYRAVDKYGNTSEASSLSVRIDKTPPEKGTLKANIRDEHGLEYEFGKVTDKSVYFRLDYLGSDQGGSELKNTTYILEEVDDNQRDHVLRTLATNEKGARTLKESGTYRVIVVTEDGAGNITRSDPYYIIIDRDFTNIIRLNNLYDVGSGIKDITITITKEGESEPTYTEQISTYEANFVKRVKLPDGTFDVNVVIQDKAGNSKTLTGKINNVIW